MNIHIGNCSCHACFNRFCTRRNEREQDILWWNKKSVCAASLCHSYLMLLVVAQPFWYWSYLKEYLMLVNDRHRPIEEVIFFLKCKIKIPPSKPEAKPRTRYLVVEQKISVLTIPLSLIFDASCSRSAFLILVISQRVSHVGKWQTSSYRRSHILFKMQNQNSSIQARSQTENKISCGGTKNQCTHHPSLAHIWFLVDRPFWYW